MITPVTLKLEGTLEVILFNLILWLEKLSQSKNI